MTSAGGLIQAKDVGIEIQRELSQLGQSLPLKIDGSSWNPGQTLDDIERAVILQALQFHSGNRTHTAKALGISIRTLRKKLAEYRKHGIFA